MSSPKRHVFISLLFILKCFSKPLIIRNFKMSRYFIPNSNLVAHCREPKNIFDALILPKLVGEYLNLPHIDEVIIL